MRNRRGFGRQPIIKNRGNTPRLSTGSLINMERSTLEKPLEGWRPVVRLKKHKEAHLKSKKDRKTSAAAEFFWNTQHTVYWGETSIHDQARRTKMLKLKEALHDHQTDHQIFKYMSFEYIKYKQNLIQKSTNNQR